MTDTTTEPRRSRRRGPAIVYGTLTTVLVVILATLAATVAAPSPPAIAQFAPQAVQQIKNPPPNSSKLEQQNVRGALGSTTTTTLLGSAGPPTTTGANGANGANGTTTTTVAASTTPTTITRVGLAHRCQGNPPRQSIDTQSPPCVPFYEGPPPGATSMGVTSNEIRVVVPCTTSGTYTCNSAFLDTNLQDFQEYFDQQFEFYTRQINFIQFELRSPPSVTGMEADAQDIAALHPFAVVGYQPGDFHWTYGMENAFYDALAAEHIVVIEGQYTAATQADLTAHAPYEWAYLPTVDMVLQEIGDLVCSSLVGQPPTYAGPSVQQQASLSHAMRRFGILYPSSASAPIQMDITPLEDRLRSCNAPFETDTYAADTTDSTGAPSYQSELLKFSNDNVTTVIPLMPMYSPLVTAMQDAETLGYQPEWITSDVYDQDEQFFAQNGEFNAPPDQQSHMIGIDSFNKSQAQPAQYEYLAPKSVDPSYSQCCTNLYLLFLLLASGIQTAGPDLTPQSFQAGLFATDFPGNANAGDSANPDTDHQSKVFFNPSQHTMQSDFAFQYQDPSQTNVQFNPQHGAYCYVDHGVRFAPGQLNRALVFTNAANGGCDPGISGNNSNA
jgi:hypothetical protein